MNSKEAKRLLDYIEPMKWLAEGRLQIKAYAQDRWDVISEASFTDPPSSYRRKPVELLQPPAGLTLHNPENFTADQVGEGFRLLCKSELQERSVTCAQSWNAPLKFWNKVDYPRHMESTYRVPASVPWPTPPSTEMPVEWVPLEAVDWIKGGPWWIRTANGFDKYLVMVVTVNYSSIGWKDGTQSHSHAFENFERTRDGINWEPCKKPKP